jgi:hypothetical protein
MLKMNTLSGNMMIGEQCGYVLSAITQNVLKGIGVTMGSLLVICTECFEPATTSILFATDEMRINLCPACYQEYTKYFDSEPYTEEEI